jgi:hypothetical protein
MARSSLKIVDRIRDTFETVNTTEVGIQVFIAKSITYS